MAQRSYKRLRHTDLRRLAAIAVADLKDLFRRKPRLARLYGNRLLRICLAQGAALHYVDRKDGIKDFDVWAFFRRHPDQPFPYRRHSVKDFGDPRFGSSTSNPEFVGRRVDLFGRSIQCSRSEPPVPAIQRWLSRGRAKSAHFLARKAVVVVYPAGHVGNVIWYAPLSG